MIEKKIIKLNSYISWLSKNPGKCLIATGGIICFIGVTAGYIVALTYTILTHNIFMLIMILTCGTIMWTCASMLVFLFVKILNAIINLQKEIKRY